MLRYITQTWIEKVEILHSSTKNMDSYSILVTQKIVKNKEKNSDKQLSIIKIIIPKFPFTVIINQNIELSFQVAKTTYLKC